MYVFYMLADNVREFEILTRRQPSALWIMFNNESVWIVPGTVSADD